MRAAKVRVIEQADIGVDGKPIYSWIIDAPYRMRGLLSRCKWINGAGCKGCFVTNSPSEAMHWARYFDVQIETNGTHDVYGFTLSVAAIVTLLADCDIP